MPADDSTGKGGPPFELVEVDPDDPNVVPGALGLSATDDGRGVLLDPQVGRPATAPGAPELDLSQTVAARGADGREYLADYRPGAGTPGAGGELRWAVSVIETKVPFDQRPTRGLLDTPEQCTDRRYQAVWLPLDPEHPNDPDAQLGAPDAPDDDPVHPVGVQSWWRAYFTEAEVAALRSSPNIVSVTYSHRVGPVGSEWAAAWSRSEFDDHWRSGQRIGEPMSEPTGAAAGDRG